jgi:hypothetical protein
LARPFAVSSLDAIPAVRASSEFEIKPIRVHFGIQSFGVNAYKADEEGGPVIEEHDELGSGAGRHEELYFVAQGRAVFTVGEDEVDAPEGTLVFIGDPAVRRGAVAREAGTTVLVMGAAVGQAFQGSRSSRRRSSAIPAIRTSSTTSRASKRSPGARSRRSTIWRRPWSRTRACANGRRRIATSTQSATIHSSLPPGKP